MTCPPDPPTDGYLLGPRCLSSKWVLMSAGAIPHSAPWLNWSDPIDIDSVTFKAITLSQRWTSHHGCDSDSWLATNYKQEGAEASLGRAGPMVRVRGVGEGAGRRGRWRGKRRRSRGNTSGTPLPGVLFDQFLTTAPEHIYVLHPFLCYI